MYAMWVVFHFAGVLFLTTLVDTLFNKAKEISSVKILEESSNHHDFNDLGQEAFKAMVTQDDLVDAVIELAIVCDKEWGDFFGHDRQKVLDYWTIFGWDLQMRFQTIQSVNITISITSITVISSIDDQQFIEEARNDEGAVSFKKVLKSFGKWVWAIPDFPEFDVAVLALKTKMAESIAGLAYVKEACKENVSAAVFADGGYLLGVALAAHEIAHVLGAGHDKKADGCQDSGFIMEERKDKQFFFSNCTDKAVADFVLSDEGGCLRKINSDPIIEPGFTSVLAPTMVEQCRTWKHNSTASIGKHDLDKCVDIVCWVGSVGTFFTPVDNTPCLGSGRCFRGRCLPKVFLLVNDATGECLLSVDHFAGNHETKMGPCPPHPTPLDSIYLKESKFLAMPYSNLMGIENEDTCLWVSTKEDSSNASFARCSEKAESWTLTDVGDGKFTLMHDSSEKFAKQEGTALKCHKHWDKSDRTFLWRFL